MTPIQFKRRYDRMREIRLYILRLKNDYKVNWSRGDYKLAELDYRNIERLKHMFIIDRTQHKKVMKALRHKRYQS